MTTRVKSAFMTPREFAECVEAIARELSLTVIVNRGPKTPLQIWSRDRAALPEASEVYLAGQTPDLDSVDLKAEGPAALGWVLFTPPRIVEGSLLKSSLAAKSDYWDPALQQSCENPESLRLFSNVWRRLRKQLRFPTYAWGLPSGKSRAYNDIGYSLGAEEWLREGGRLAQEGVRNVAFGISPPD